MTTRMRRWLARALAVAVVSAGALGMSTTVAQADPRPVQPAVALQKR